MREWRSAEVLHRPLGSANRDELEIDKPKIREWKVLADPVSV